MSYKIPFNFAEPMVDKDGKATQAFQLYFTTLLRAVAATSGNPHTIPLAKITGGGDDGQITVDGGVVISSEDPT